MVEAGSLTFDKNSLTLLILGLVVGILLTLWLWESFENRSLPKDWKKKTSPAYLQKVLQKLNKSYPQEEFHPFTRVLDWAEMRTTKLPQKQRMKILQRFNDSMDALVEKGAIQESDGPSYRIKTKGKSKSR